MTPISLLFPWRGHPDRERQFEWVRARWRACFPDIEVLVGESPPGPFNRSAALNNAARHASNPVLIAADADTTFCDPTAMSIVAADVASGAVRWAIPYDVYYNLTGDSTAALLAQDPARAERGIHHPTVWEHRLTDSVSGIVVIPAAGWDKVGGFDERFVDWGFEDRAIVAALDTLWGPHRRYAGDLLHLWHREGARFDNPNARANQRLAARYAAADGNPFKMADILLGRGRERSTS